ncbi:hypothetical protein B0H15DRAFT_281845 [Mycena belliarum]|uniref:Uncharacterized protein n=1 Tax=Mycena belliarum TaxID=1033014 RepID=A0AAD6U4T0_9AGAR|nr:hypothetical protein B0H15DRAFT_281845 [Mycena belliae]
MSFSADPDSRALPARGSRRVSSAKAPTPQSGILDTTAPIYWKLHCAARRISRPSKIAKSAQGPTSLHTQHCHCHRTTQTLHPRFLSISPKSNRLFCNPSSLLPYPQFNFHGHRLRSGHPRSCARDHGILEAFCSVRSCALRRTLELVSYKQTLQQFEACASFCCTLERRTAIHRRRLGPRLYALHARYKIHSRNPGPLKCVAPLSVANVKPNIMMDMNR